jgi:hypothetical protein
MTAKIVLRPQQLFNFILTPALLKKPAVLRCAVLCCPVLCCVHHPLASQGLEQSCLLQRLGPARLFSPTHPSAHWVLDLSHPAHEDVARRLVSMAAASTDLPCIWNLRLRGV